MRVTAMVAADLAVDGATVQASVESRVREHLVELSEIRATSASLTALEQEKPRHGGGGAANQSDPGPFWGKGDLRPGDSRYRRMVNGI